MLKKRGIRSEKQILDHIQNLYSSNPSIRKISRDVTVGKMNADIYLQSSAGTTSVFQIKSWEPTLENQDRAKNLASIYKTLSSTDNAYVVIPGLEKSDPENGVIAPEFFNQQSKYFFAEQKKSKSTLPKVQKAPSKIVFAAMPFAKSYDDTFEVGIQGACLKLGYKAVRVDHQAFVGDIVSEIKVLIRKSAAVIGDLSENRPNVLYEIGFAHAMNRVVVQICSTPMENIPFDVRNNKTIHYEIGQTVKLKDNLSKELKVILLEKKPNNKLLH
jgi:hypothetical protein